MSSAEEIPYRPLGIIVTMIESLGLKVTHFHDDLVFIEHNAFMLQMGEKGEDLFVWFNVDCVPEKSEKIMNMLLDQGKQQGLILEKKGTYRLTPNEEDETLQIEFI